MFIYIYPKQGKIAVSKSNCHKELLILKKWLLCRIFVLKKKLFWKNTCCEKVTVLKKEKKAAALKKHLLQKCNCCGEVVTLKKCEKVTSPKTNLSWKSRNTCEKGNHYLKTKNRLVKLNLFPHPGKFHLRFPMNIGPNRRRKKSLGYVSVILSS